MRSVRDKNSLQSSPRRLTGAAERHDAGNTVPPLTTNRVLARSMAAPTNPSLPVLSTRVPEGRYAATAEEQAIVASWEAAHPFTPDTSSAYGLPAIIAAVTAIAAFGPILLLSLLRWIVTGRRGFGFRL
jgi:hypothetical protein